MSNRRASGGRALRSPPASKRRSPAGRPAARGTGSHDRQRSASADGNGSARREPFGWMALSVLAGVSTWDLMGYGRPPNASRREPEVRAQDLEHAVDNDANQPKWEQQKPEDRVTQKREQCQRAADSACDLYQQNQPEQELQDGDLIRSRGTLAVRTSDRSSAWRDRHHSRVDWQAKNEIAVNAAQRLHACSRSLRGGARRSTRPRTHRISRT